MLKTVGECLKKYRDDLGWQIKQASIETMLSVSSVNIGRIERGEVKNPGINSVIQLLNAYNKTLTDLDNDMHSNVVDLHAPKEIESPKSKMVPVIQITDVEKFIKGGEYEIIKYIPSGENQSSKAFAIRMSNDFMRSDGNRTYPKNSYVIFEPTRSFKTNNDILAKVNGKTLFFRILKEDEDLYLKKLNNDYKNEPLSEPPITYARAIECRIICKN